MNDQSQHIRPDLRPDVKAIRTHLERLFGGFLDGHHNGMVEIGWTANKPTKDGRYPLCNGRLFGTDELDEAAEEAARLSAISMQCLYVGAALRRKDVKPGKGGRCSGDDFEAAPLRLCRSRRRGLVREGRGDLWRLSADLHRDDRGRTHTSGRSCGGGSPSRSPIPSSTKPSFAAWRSPSVATCSCTIATGSCDSAAPSPGRSNPAGRKPNSCATIGSRGRRPPTISRN